MRSVRVEACCLTKIFRLSKFTFQMWVLPAGFHTLAGQRPLRQSVHVPPWRGMPSNNAISSFIFFFLLWVIVAIVPVWVVERWWDSSKAGSGLFLFLCFRHLVFLVLNLYANILYRIFLRFIPPRRQPRPGKTSRVERNATDGLEAQPEVRWRMARIDSCGPTTRSTASCAPSSTGYVEIMSEGQNYE